MMGERLGITPKGAKPEMTINEAATRYFAEVGATVKTHDQIDFNLAWVASNLNTEGAGPNTKLSEITEPMLLTLAARRRAAGDLRAVKGWRACDEKTINRSCLDLVRRLLRRARLTWKVAYADIDWAAVRAPEPREGKTQHELPVAQQDAFFAAIRPDVREACEFLLISGVRSGAVITMEWSKHVDFDAGFYRVKRKTKKRGEFWQEVPMTKRTRALLLAQRGRHERYVWTYVVHRRRPGGLGRGSGAAVGERRPLSKTVLRQCFERARKATGLEWFRVHDLRHTKARRQLRTTKDIRTLQRTLGHSDIATTAIYADVLTEDIRAAMEEAEAAYQPPKNPGGKQVVSRETHVPKGKKRA